MAVVYDTTTKNNRLQEVIDRIGAGGVLEILTAGATVLASIALGNPAAPAPVGGVVTFTMPQSDVAADASGVAALARIRQSGGTVIVSGLTVGTSGTDVVINSTQIDVGETVTITSATITHG